eukprot:3791103-Pleurochrysis_carterae.AAC.2
MARTYARFSRPSEMSVYSCAPGKNKRQQLLHTGAIPETRRVAYAVELLRERHGVRAAFWHLSQAKDCEGVGCEGDERICRHAKDGGHLTKPGSAIARLRRCRESSAACVDDGYKWMMVQVVSGTCTGMSERARLDVATLVTRQDGEYAR